MILENKSKTIQKRGLWYCCGTISRSNYCSQCGASYPVDDKFNVSCAQAINNFTNCLARLRAANSLMDKYSENMSDDEVKQLLATSDGNIRSAIEEAESAVKEIKNAAKAIKKKVN